MKRTRRILVAALGTFGVLAGLAAPAQAVGDERARAEKVLVSQGLPAELATAVAQDPENTFTVKGDEVYMNGGDLHEATAAANSVIVSAAKGSDWWYAAAISPTGFPRTVVYIRYSWSWMWDLRNSLSNITTYGNLMCGLLASGGATLVAACLIVVKAYMDLAGAKIKQGIAQKKCLRWRITAPPLVDPTMLRWDLVTCRV